MVKPKRNPYAEELANKIIEKYWPRAMHFGEFTGENACNG